MAALKIVFETVEIRKMFEPIEKSDGKYLKIWKEFMNKILNQKSKMIKHKKFNKFLVSIFTLIFLTVQGLFPLSAIAETDPTITPAAPTQSPEPTVTVTETVTPTPPPEPTQPVAPSAPEAPTAPTAPSAPEAPTAPTLTEATTVDPLPIPHSNDEEVEDSSSNDSGGYTGAPDSSAGTSPVSSATVGGTGGNTEDGQSGSTSIITGDADNVGNISTTANTNISVGSSDSGGGITVGNSGNGSSSDNSSSANLTDNTNKLQNNQANVGNNLTQRTITGDNSASRNTGGNQNIGTGDANTTGTIVTAVNTNLDGLSVYEFNITDDQNGNYVLDFNPANCISGCGSQDTTVRNTGNGAASTNDANANLNNNDNSFQTNDGTVENNMTLVSDSGDNTANQNTGGDSTISTGDANVSGNILNMVNNNIAGNVVYAVVNVFGNLVGDIVLPDSALLGCCTSDTTVQNSGNGADSTNTASADVTNTSNTTQFNNADIQNNLIVDADTGNNDANKNTDGSSSITTGDANILAQVLNVANINLSGGNFWLVLVNEAGKWIGRIVGSDGQNYAASDNLEFLVDENGEITVVNAGNGAGSTNNSSVNQDTNTNVQQTNNASIVNNVHLDANTGDNNANYNTGGNNSITTGDANIVANIVNFVNNNIVGAGKLFVTVINVFGSWVGNFVGPGQHSDTPTADNPGIGGSSEQANNQPNNSQDTSDDSTATTAVAANIQPKSHTNVKAGSLGKLANVLASASFSDESVASNSQPDSFVKGQTAGKKVIKINLAYLLFIIPGAVGFAVLRRKRVFSKVFSAGKHNA